MVNIGVYKEEKECFYKGESYSVRDNGAVCRHPREGGRKRKMDGVWTFGSRDHRGYLFISGVQVHRIVATAFHGEAPSDQHVIDHIDTNRMNNRPENLRWVTRLENILLNPITVKKIELATGHDIEDVLNDITLLRGINLPPNISWMSQVSEQEARMSLLSYREWAKEKRPGAEEYYETNKRSSYIESLTKHAARVKQWHVNGYFPIVEKCTEICLENYLSAISEDSELFISETREQYRIIAKKAEIAPDGKKLMIICECGGVKPFALMSVEVIDGCFVHSYQMFFGYDGAEKYYELSLGREWTGGMVFDDYC